MPSVRDPSRTVRTPTTASTTSTSSTTPAAPASTPTTPPTWGAGGPAPARDGFTSSAASPLSRDPALAQVAAGTTSLAKGAKGDAVKSMQQALMKAGYSLPKFGADADFGKETLTALKKFQKDAGLPQSGRFDKATLAKLDAKLTPATPPGPRPPAGPPATYLLRDPALAGVASGQLTLAEGATGPGVVKAQEALMLAGYKLPRFGADGDFGGETTAALKQLQARSGINPPTGRLDQATLQALDVAAAGKLKFPDFGKLFADGKLNSTIAVGYDEAGWHHSETREVVKGLVGDGTAANPGQGYKELNARTATDAQLRAAGLDPATTDRDVRYFVKSFKHDGKDVQSIVKLITPDTPNAKDKFAREMASSEMVMYAGHGRYGSGPDFDDIHSTAGNFVIGSPYEAGHVTLGENDLQKTAMTKDYQMMLFSGCSTFRYLDDLRAKQGKNAGNLDLMVSSTELYWGKLGPNTLEMLSSVTAGRSMNEMTANLEAINARPGVKSTWKSDGFDDN